MRRHAHRHGESLALSGRRRILRDEYGGVYYLGERVSRQYAWDAAVRVPQAPPPYTRHPDDLSEEAFAAGVVGVEAVEVSQEGDYMEFVARRVMTHACPVPVEVLRAFGPGVGGEAQPEVPGSGGLR